MAKNDAADSPADGPRLWLVLARAYGSMAAYVEHCLEADGYCLSDFMVLEVLLHKGSLSPSAIGEKVLLANASMTAAVDRLEKRGMVSRQSSGKDRRSKVIALTREGRAFISELYGRHVHDLEAVTEALSEKERNKLRTLLKTLGLAAKDADEKRRKSSAGKGARSKA